MKLELSRLRVFLKKHDKDNALRAYQCIVNCAGHLQREPFVIGSLIWLNVENNRLDGMEKLLESRLLTDDELKRLDNDLTSLEERIPINHNQAMFTEAAFGQDVIWGLETGETEDTKVAFADLRWFYPQLWLQASLDKNNLLKQYLVKDFADFCSEPVPLAYVFSSMLHPVLKSVGNKFHALTSLDRIVFAHGAMKALAADMMKIANDIRWLSSGPRCGLGEIFIPENEPGSSIMPGKVNPTQCEAITMIAVQVMGNDATIGMAASQGNFQLNVFLPVTAYNFLQSAKLLTDGILSFEQRCVSGITANKEKMSENLHRSLMLVTSLNPYIGYDNSARVAKKAYKENLSLKEACLQLGFMSEEEFDRVFHPEELV